VTLIGGRRREERHPVTEHLSTRVYPTGERRNVPTEVLVLLQDQLLYTLPGWYMEHDLLESVAEPTTAPCSMSAPNVIAKPAGD
jgi:hypothetical protein